MESVLGRYRNLIVLTAVLFAQVLGLAVQVRRTTDTESTRLIRVWAVSAVTPFEKALAWTQNSSGGIWHNYFYLRGVRAENRELKRQIEEMRLQQARMAQDADQARRLQALLSFKEQFISQTMAAQVIGLSGSEQSRAVYIDKGEKDGIKPDMAVINTDGIVGKVLRAYSSTSLVLLLDDQTSGVGAILEKSRLQGILRGTPNGEIVLDKVMSDETVTPGELVLTSGGDRIFPKGLPIGIVGRVATPQAKHGGAEAENSQSSETFLSIQVKTTADLNKLEEVLVVTKIDERQAAPDIAGPQRAADILAERLPTVPPKPETAAGPAAAQAGTKQGTPATAPGKPAQPGSNSTPPAASPKVAGAAPGNATSKPAASAESLNATTTAPAKPKPSAPATSNGAPPKPAAKTVPAVTTGAQAVSRDNAAGAPANLSPSAVKSDVSAKPQTPPEDKPQ